VDINKVVGTGPYGRITPEDIEAAAGIQPKQPVPVPVAQAMAAPTKTAPAAAASASLPPPLQGSSVVPFTTMQGAVSKNMMESLSVPTFRVGYPITTDALDALYAKVF
jgi:pyruvate dehydrogenase E2 component (dihydrolipoamide acetyltransferase)